MNIKLISDLYERQSSSTVMEVFENALRQVDKGSPEYSEIQTNIQLIQAMQESKNSFR